MKTNNLIHTCLAGAAFAALLLPAARAQSAPPADPQPGPGLIGTNYTEFDFGYQKQGFAPQVLHDYDFTYNQSLYRGADWGIDGNITYENFTGSALGQSDYRNELEGGLTGYLREIWGKPFLSADAGGAWQRAGGFSERSFAYTFTGGVEFEILSNLAVTPFLSYQEEPRLYNPGTPAVDIPNRDWNYGLKATYRINRRWSASAGLSQDNHSREDLTYLAGISYHF